MQQTLLRNMIASTSHTASKQEACGFVVIILRDFSNEGDIGMANYEKRVEQEAAYPIPISLYNDSEA